MNRILIYINKVAYINIIPFESDDFGSTRMLVESAVCTFYSIWYMTIILRLNQFQN